MHERRSIVKTVVLIILVAALGVLAKLYPSEEAMWVCNHLAGTFYVVELALILHLVFPDHMSFLLAMAAFLITSLVEFLQIWHPDFLESFRASFIGHTILGSTFSWLDFPWYLAGAIIGWGLLQWIRPRQETGGLEGK
jgi:hypothetical protein